LASRSFPMCKYTQACPGGNGSFYRRIFREEAFSSGVRSCIPFGILTSFPSLSTNTSPGFKSFILLQRPCTLQNSCPIIMARASAILSACASTFPVCYCLQAPELPRISQVRVYDKVFSL
jgi:hypothetical protein